MGSGSKDTKTTKALTVTKPDVPKFISGPVEDYAAGVSRVGAMDPQSFANPATVNQMQGFARAGVGTGNPVAGLAGYTPQNVTAGQLRDTDLSPYLNRYQGDVIDAATTDWTHSLDEGLNRLRSNTPRGAAFGSRDAVAQGQFVGDSQRNFNTQIAGLRSQGFGNAQQAAMQDIANRLGADQSNVNSGLQGADFRLRAGLAGAANTRADTDQMLQAGETERGINSANNPAALRAQLQQLVGSLLGGIPIGSFTGQTQDQSGTETTRHTPGRSEERRVGKECRL